jgi:transposase, IS30 family
VLSIATGDIYKTAVSSHCIVTLVERKTRYTLIGKLRAHTAAELNRKVIQLIKRDCHLVRTITADIATEFHQFRKIESAINTTCYFCTPYHFWERGTNENTNGLVRQYIAKGTSMADLTQRDCDKIAKKLNTRPIKTLDAKTPEECYATI